MARGGATTATTYIRPYKQAAGLSAVQTMEERFAYGLNPQKLGAVSSHLCDPATAAAEFLLVKSEYQAATARQVGLIIDIQQRMAEGKGPAYERWAKVYNLKQMPFSVRSMCFRRSLSPPSLSG